MTTCKGNIEHDPSKTDEGITSKLSEGSCQWHKMFAMIFGCQSIHHPKEKAEPNWNANECYMCNFTVYNTLWIFEGKCLLMCMVSMTRCWCMYKQDEYSESAPAIKCLDRDLFRGMESSLLHESEAVSHYLNRQSLKTLYWKPLLKKIPTRPLDIIHGITISDRFSHWLRALEWTAELPKRAGYTSCMGKAAWSFSLVTNFLLDSMQLTAINTALILSYCWQKEWKGSPENSRHV